MTVPVIISIAVALAIFVLGEFFIPVDPKAPNRELQKHFWASVLAVGGLIISLQFAFIGSTSETVKETREAVRNVSKIFQGLVEDSLQTTIGGIVMHLSNDFDEHVANELLRRLVVDELDHLHKDLVAGFVPIPHHSLQSTVEASYAGAHDFADSVGGPPYIVATNVGDTETYFQNWYETANNLAIEESVPVIRFFFHDPGKLVALSGDTVRRQVDMPEMWEEVLRIHRQFQSVYSALIGPDCNIVERDLLIVSGYMLLETELEHQDDNFVRATTLGIRLDDANEYLSGLHTKLSTCLQDSPHAAQTAMSNDEVTDLFGDIIWEQWGEVKPADSLGYRLKELVMKSLTGG